MRYIAVLILCSLVLTSCGGGSGGGSTTDTSCSAFDVRLVIEHQLPTVQTTNELLPLQSGWWGIVKDGAPTFGGTVQLRDPFGAVTTLTIGGEDTGRYFSPDIPGTWEMWAVTPSGCTTKIDTFFVHGYDIEMSFPQKFVAGGQDWGIEEANGTPIVGSPGNPVLLAFFDGVGNLEDIVQLTTSSSLYYTPAANSSGVGFVVGMLADGRVTPIRQFNFLNSSCDLGVEFPGFILPKGVAQPFTIALFGSSTHSGGSYTIRHEGTVVEQNSLGSSASSFSWTPLFDGHFTVELELLLPCGSQETLPYPITVR